MNIKLVLRTSPRWIILVLLAFLVTCARTPETALPPPQVSTPSAGVAPQLTGSPLDLATTLAAPLTNGSSSPPPFAAPTATTTVIGVPLDQPQSFPEVHSYTWKVVVEGLESPVGLAHAADGSHRLFILEQRGRVRVYDLSGLQAAPFLDITPRVGSSASEQGLLGIAFHPRFAQTGAFYVNYTDRRGDTVIAEFRLPDPTISLVDADTERILMRIPQPFDNHNGGAMAFGPDGFLYLGLGDGGSAGDPLGNAQSRQTLLGKILRIDVDHGVPYAIPADNPFASGGGLSEIWALGLRNPWRFSFDRLTGDLYIGDVGQNQWEEIDFLPRGVEGGANLGWNYYEGSHPFSGSAPSGVDFVPPVAEYDHSQGCSVTGGVVYRGSRLPAFRGIYLFGDFCSGTIWGMLYHPNHGWQIRRLFENVARIASFGEDEAGEIYIVDYAGRILQLVEGQ